MRLRIMTKNNFKTLFFASLFLVLVAPGVASAHQPRIVESVQTFVSDPEISKAYYGKLTGEPDVYTIASPVPFNLYVGVLVPDIRNQKKDVSAVVLKDGVQVVVLEGSMFPWTKFFEKFGHDTYWQGPEYKAHVDAGNYEIRVWSSNNDSKYSLAIGGQEKFNFEESLNALTLIPEIKKNFFEKSPMDFIFSPLGWGFIIGMYVLAFLVGFMYRQILRKVSIKPLGEVRKNIGKIDRSARFAIGLGLLLWAVTTTWSPILIFFSGFAFFEALAGWCILYAALGRNTCPTNS